MDGFDNDYQSVPVMIHNSIIMTVSITTNRPVPVMNQKSNIWAVSITTISLFT